MRRESAICPLSRRASASVSEPHRQRARAYPALVAAVAGLGQVQSAAGRSFERAPARKTQSPAVEHVFAGCAKADRVHRPGAAARAATTLQQRPLLVGQFLASGQAASLPLPTICQTTSRQR